MPRFVILTHTHPSLHWDFMLEVEAGLLTWRLNQPPHAGPPVSAEALPIHRKAYLDYEGPVSGNRGEVQCWDRGDYELVRNDPGCVLARLSGTRLQGTAQLMMNEDTGVWSFEFLAESERSSAV